jgi:hypothetical protein
MRKRWRIVIVVAATLVLGSAGASALAITQVHEKQPLATTPSGGIIDLDNRTDFVQAHARPMSAESLNVPVYRQSELVTNNESSFFLGRDSGFYRFRNLRFDLFDRIETLFPSTAIRLADDAMSSIYVMYDTDKGQRLFLFFSKTKNDYLTVDGFPILMAKRLSSSDFASLRVGDGMDAVAAIDPAADEYRPLFDSGNDTVLENYTKMGAPPTSIHLLTDGVLKVEYARDKNLGYVITQLVFAEDFVLQGLDGKTCYRVADADYVK